MMTDVERQVQARLTLVLDELTPGPAPLAAIIRDGRRVRVRKRMSTIAGLAATAALVIAVPLTLPSLLSRRVPPLTTHYHVTVLPPGPDSPRGQIASGRVNGVPWSVRAKRSAGGYLFTGVDTFVPRGSSGNLPASFAHGEPVDLFIASASAPAIQVEAVRSDVTLVRVTLTNGQVLKLRPVAALGSGGASLIAFAMPDYRDVLRIEAFGTHGEVGYTVPWTGHSWFDTGRWLKPGQPALPRPETAVIGSGTALGQNWRQLVSAGPWGWCGQGDVDGRGGAGECVATPPPLRAGQYVQVAGFAGGSVIGQAAVIWTDEVAASVAVVEVTMRSGQHTWIRPQRIGGRWFVSFSSAIDQRSGSAVIRWTAYDRHHHQLASGPAQHT